jgi:rhamnogalacturonyl hydrolase YesR
MMYKLHQVYVNNLIVKYQESWARGCTWLKFVLHQVLWYNSEHSFSFGRFLAQINQQARNLAVVIDIF